MYIIISKSLKKFLNIYIKEILIIEETKLELPLWILCHKELTWHFWT